jgi:hypothetical protein
VSAPAIDPALHAVLCASLVLLFLLAAAHKLRAPRSFAAQLAEYRLLPAAASLPGALALAGAELALCLGLCAPALSRPASAGAALLLALYAGAIAINLLRGRDAIDCGCGFAPRPLGAGLLLRNALLAAGALTAALPVLPRALGWVDAVTIAGGTATAALVFGAADGLAARLARSA